MLILATLLGTIALILQGIIVPTLPYLAYAPVISLYILRCSLNRALWASVGCGALVDLISDDPMGIHALNYALTTAILYRFRKHFLYEQPLHLSLFAAFTSSLSTALHLLLLFLFDRRIPFNGKWFFADLAGLPAIDALYAFVWFAAPLALFVKIHRIWVLFWLKKKNSSPSPTSH